VCFTIAEEDWKSERIEKKQKRFAKLPKYHMVCVQKWYGKKGVYKSFLEIYQLRVKGK